MDDARTCRAIAWEHARTFTMASRLLPEEKRRAAFAIYATCRRADDLVDSPVPHDVGAGAALARFRRAAFLALESRSTDPVLRELARAVDRFDVPPSALAEVFEGVAMDLEPRVFRTWSELEHYCQAVAGSVGEMTCAVFGVPRQEDRPHATRCARTLGVAMQLTNIVRDVGEDARRGRCYFPLDELALHGLRPDDLLTGSALTRPSQWRSFMSFQVARARTLYAEAIPGIAVLASDAQRCALACASGYARILDAAEQCGFDTFSRRVSTSTLTLLAVAWQSWRKHVPDFRVPLTP